MTPFCWLIRRRLSAYQDRELSPGVRARVAAHVEGCDRCRGELLAFGRLRAALTLNAADPSEAVWATFWPQVRARIAAPAPAPAPVWRRAWDGVRARPRLGLAPALAAAALAVLAVVTPWQQRAPQQLTAPVQVGSGLEAPGGTPVALNQVVIQSIETADPDVPVMVYESPESNVTVLWVFGLPQTDI
jgi:anti-sigma factor RsiW